MARDYKSRNNDRKSSAKSGGSSIWSGIFIGLAVGLVAAVAVAYWVNRSDPFAARDKPAESKPVADKQASRSDKVIDPLAKATNAPTTPDKPSFDFYKILPSQDNPAPNADTPKPSTPDALYFVQAGAFPNAEDADNLKARLALMGYEAAILATDIPNKGTWHRVRLGPYKLDEANKTKDTLEQNKVSATLIKVPASASTKTN
ncbi:MAG: SPOR domain-containing protein [Sulfuriferula sp.]|nr:SPOR domain-containing protein [Sulfuriferula sp.]